MYYVYKHVCPKTQEIVYYGKGIHGRAWDVTRARNHNPEHQNWMKQLCQEGFTPPDWVVILKWKLSEKEALRLEKEYIHQGQTRFNNQSGERNYQAKLTDAQACEIYLSSVPVRELAKKYNVSRAAIYHIKKGTQWRSATSNIRN